MKGRMYIDGTDAWEGYGVFVGEGGYAGPLTWPPLKKVKVNDWPEEEGTEPDLSAPALASAEFSLPLCGVNERGMEALFRDLTREAYHTFEFREIGWVRRARLVSKSAVKFADGREQCTLKLADDDTPLKGYSYEAPRMWDGVPVQGYELDGVDLSHYGVRLLQGTEESVRALPAAKKSLSVDLAGRDGLICDGETVRFQSGEVTLGCYMKAPDAASFRRNYLALLHDLVRPRAGGGARPERGGKLLYVPCLGRSLVCYYKNGQVQQAKTAGGGVNCHFTVTMVCASWPEELREWMLAAEEGTPLVTEEGKGIRLLIRKGRWEW